MPVLSIFRRLVSWVTGISSESVSSSVSVASSRSCVVRWAPFSQFAAFCLRFLVSRFWAVVYSVLVINRVMLVCSLSPCLCQPAPGLAPVHARLLSLPRCHCFVTVSQCLVVRLSCRVLHCCRFVLSAEFGFPIPSLAGVELVSCIGREMASTSVCSFLFGFGPVGDDMCVYSSQHDDLMLRSLQIRRGGTCLARLG